MKMCVHRNGCGCCSSCLRLSAISFLATQALGLRRVLMSLYEEAIKNRTYAEESETLREAMHRASLLLMQYVRQSPSAQREASP